MEHGEVTNRLRQLGRTTIEPELASRHLSTLAATQPSGRRPLARVAVAAGAATLLIAAPGAALVASLGDDPAPLVPTEQEAPADEYSCTGPPPFAGEPAEPADPDGGVDRSPRADEAEAFEAWREANCPDDEADDAGTEGDAEVDDEVDDTEGSTDDGCTGPPDFAGEPATPADPASGAVPSQRAEEAREHAEARQACGGEGEPGDDEVDRGGPPASVPGRGEPGGPRDVSQPGGPPDELPAGPPADPPGDGDGAGSGGAGPDGDGSRGSASRP